MTNRTTALESVPSYAVDAFNRVILELQTRVRHCSISTFHQQALLLAGSLVGFDKAWWGQATWAEDLPTEHSSYLLGLPEHYTQQWGALKDRDVSLARMNRSPGVCQVIDCTAPSAPEDLADLGRQYDLSYALAIMVIDPHTQLGVHLTLFRSMGAQPFSPLEQRLVEWLMPHLLVAEQASYIRTLAALRDSQGSYDETAMAVSDRCGVLLSAEPAFTLMLAAQWPAGQGNRLPEPCIAEEGYQGRSVQIESTPIGDLLLLTARRRSPLTILSAREREVAHSFAVGLTYKEVARQMGVSPCTVRHHLRNIYGKLGIKRKGHIAQFLTLAER